VAQHVPQEVHGAALPGAAEHLGDRGLEALVGVRDAELGAGQAAGAQGAQELTPEGLGLGLADVDADDLSAPALVDAVGDDQSLVADAAQLPDALHLGVEPEVRVAAFERPLAEEAHLLVEARAETAHGAPAHADQAELGHEAFDLARAHAIDVRLLHDRDQRLLAAAARLQEAGEVGAAPQARDLQGDLAGPRLPGALAVAVPVRHALGALLMQVGADLPGDLGLHELAHEPGERLSENVGVLIAHELAYELVQTHARLGHRGAPLVVSLGTVPTILGPTMVFLHPGPLQDLRMKVKLWTAFFPCVILPVGASD